MKGLYLVPPHGELIADGKKKSVAKSKFEPGHGLFDLRGKKILVSGEYAYGVLTLGEPEKVSTDEFDDKYEEHLVSKRDRLRWWPTAKELWLYPVQAFQGYEQPRKVKVPPGVQTIMREVDFKQRADDVLDKLAGLPDRFVWIPDFVSLTGSQIYAKDREPNDVDVILRAQEDGSHFTLRVPVDAAFALKLERLLKDSLGTDGEVQYTGNPYGANWKSLPLYDLCLVRKSELKYFEPDEPEFAALEYKARTLTTSALDRLLRGASAEVKQQAKTSFDEDSVKPGRAFVPLKPLRSATEGQRQTLDVFLDYIETNLDFPLYISAKRDGYRATIHSNDGKVTVFSDDGAIVTDKLPTLVKKLGKLGKTWVIDCELELWKDGQHYPREATAGVIHSGSGDEDIAANIFRLLHWDGKDLHNEPFEDVWATMQKLPTDTKTDGKLYPKKNGPVNLVPHYEAKSLDALKSKTLDVAYKPGVEGVVVKRLDGVYPLDGQPGSPPTSLKWHKSFECIATVTGKTETKTSGVWIYNYSLGGMEAGKTFGTKTSLGKGAHFILEGEQLNLERDDSGKVSKVSVWVPELIEATDKGAESLETVVKRAKDHGVLQEKIRRESGEVEYLPTDAGKPSTASKEFEGAAIMLFLPIKQAKKLAALIDVDGAKPTKPKDMHLTLAFLGKAKDIEEKRPLIEAILEQFANTAPPIAGKIGGAGRFLKVEEDGTNAVYATFDSSGLGALRERLVSSLASIGVEPGSDHDFTPHITLAYAPSDIWELPKVEPIEVKFGEVVLGWGDERKAYPLSGKEGKKAGEEAYPDESKKLRFVAQNHYRGRSCHLDLRFEYKRGSTDYLRGWTVAHQVAGAIKEPVTTMEQAEKLDANPRNWKMDLKTGFVKPRQIRGGTVRRGDLRAFQKAAEIPKDWLNTEGVTEKQDPGEPPPAGATKQYPGVFTILDKGEVEWGAQKPWFHEWFLEGGKWKGRWCFRLVKREGKKFFSPETIEEYEAIKAEILPPGKEEEDARTGSFWLLMQPKVQTPYVLSKEAIEEDWLPPKGVSCLPAKMRKSVPKELQYWTMDRPKALEARDKLAEFEELGGTELKLLVLREIK